MASTPNFDLLAKDTSKIKAYTPAKDAPKFLIQDILRFISIVGTLKNSSFSLDTTSSVDERYFTHILIRSLLESYFTNLYIFSDLKEMDERYEEFVNGFKMEYLKLMNNINESTSDLWEEFRKKYSSQLEAADSSWKNLPKMRNMHDILVKLKNDNFGGIPDLYPFYRISSFDTHAQSLGAIFECVFKKTSNFPIIDISKAVELMADSYISILHDLKSQKYI